MKPFKELQELFNSNNAIESMKPCFIILKILGHAPINIINNKKIKISWLGIIFTLNKILNFFYCFIILFPNLTSKRQLNQLISIGDYILSYVLSAIFFITRLKSLKKYFEILKEINKVDKSFQKLNIKFNYKDCRRKIVIKHLFTFLFMIWIHVFNCFIGDYVDVYYPRYLLFIHTWQEISKVFLLLMSCTISDFLKERFKVVNQELEKYSKKKIIFNGNKFYKLRMMHGDLCDLCENFNKIESIPILSILCSLFLLFIFNVYYFYSNVYNNGDRIELRFIYLFIILFRFSLYGVFTIPRFVALAKEVKKFFV